MKVKYKKTGPSYEEIMEILFSDNKAARADTDYFKLLVKISDSNVAELTLGWKDFNSLRVHPSIRKILQVGFAEENGLCFFYFYGMKVVSVREEEQ